ncbi:MAG: hypothetical protein RLZZ324_480 [Candidatus Parcubacteria bacterium]|jgi:ABC-type multidrug transport system fused ATPase/permease subunit
MRDVLDLLVRELRPFKRTVFVASLFALLAAVFDTLAPVAMGRGFDVANHRGTLVVLIGWLAGWLVLGTGGDLIRSYIARKGGLLANEIGDTYTRRVAVSLVKKPLSFHYGKKNQESSDAIGEMRWTLEQMINGIVFDLMPSVIAMVAILGYVTLLDWRIAACLAVAMGAFTWFTGKQSPRTLEYQEAWMKARRKASSAAWDAIRNVLVVKSTANEAHVYDRVEAYATEAAPLIVRDFDNDRYVRDMQAIIIRAGTVLAVTFSLLSVRLGQMTLGQGTVVIAYSFAVFGYLRYFQWNVRTYIRLSANMKAVKELLEVQDEDYSSGADREISGSVELQGVRFRYSEDKPALEDVSFSVQAGQRVAIVGESGEGKTTMVDLLGRYYLPQSGEITYDGIPAREINLRALRRQMALVPQDLTLFHETIGYNIRYGRPDATDEEMRLAARQADLEEFIDGLPEKWETKVGERGLKLSGGERQRVALARAFLRDPRILVLDEPTAHLDSVTEGRIQHALETLMKGRTTFVIAHRLRTVQDADLILVLKDGRIAESGRHAELVKKNGAYATLLKAQGMFIPPSAEQPGSVPSTNPLDLN